MWKAATYNKSKPRQLPAQRTSDLLLNPTCVLWPNVTRFSDLALARRLEGAEGHACAQFAEARHRLFPDSGSEWMECSGAYVVFDGIASPLTQTFGLGIFEELTAASLELIERFFFDRGAQVDHEMSPLAGVAALNLLCSRQYRPIEISNVMYRPTEKQVAEDHGNIRVRVTGPEEAQLWTDTNAKGWTHEHPELRGFLLQTTAISAARDESPCFLAARNFNLFGDQRPEIPEVDMTRNELGK
jgi:hypothetical protein